MKEPFPYRARKYLCQQVTGRRGGSQHRRLDATDWDILLVLDACRADALREVAHWPIETVTSPASCTPEWLGECVSTGVLDAATVVSGNAQYAKVTDELGATVERYWERHWNDELSTVLPEPILDRVTEIADADAGPAVGHLQQPHWPYVAKLDGSWRLAYDDLGPWADSDGEIDSLQVAMARGHVDVEAASDAYSAAVWSVWDAIAPYLREWLDAGYTTVVTADHGEVFGRARELRLYEHPCGCHVAPLVEVPWVEFRPRTATDAAESVEGRLKALGYAE